jgi:HD-like signal output (HDOD) protein
LARELTEIIARPAKYAGGAGPRERRRRPGQVQVPPPQADIQVMSIVSISPEALLQVANSFPATRRILMQLGNLLRDPSVNLERVVAPLRQDPALAARLIRSANSAAYAQSEPVASVEAAATLIGFREVHRLVGLALLNEMGEDGLPAYGISSSLFRENSLFAALLMENLAPGAQEDPRSCYTIGLLRSIGKVALDRLARSLPSGEVPERKEDTAVLEWESCVFGITSNEAAATIMNAWRFPREIVSAISDHIAPEGRHMPLTHMLHLAAGMADLLGHGLPGESTYWNDSESTFRRAGLEPIAANRIIDQSLNSFNRLLQARS